MGKLLYYRGPEAKTSHLFYGIFFVNFMEKEPCTNFRNFWLMVIFWFSFKMKEDHFKQKILLWPQVPFKLVNSCHIIVSVNTNLIMQVVRKFK